MNKAAGRTMALLLAVLVASAPLGAWADKTTAAGPGRGAGEGKAKAKEGKKAKGGKTAGSPSSSARGTTGAAKAKSPARTQPLSRSSIKPTSKRAWVAKESWRLGWVISSLWPT